MPIALSIIGIVLIIGGIFTSGIRSQKPKSFPQQSLVKSEGNQISIDVSGSVNMPGVYKISEGARIEDAIRAAGGFTDNADKEYISKSINLAQKVSDGSKIYVPSEGEQINTANLSVMGVTSQGKININTASSAELEALPGVGTVTAGKIIAGRPYQEVSGLVSKKVIGNSLYEKVKEQLVVY